MTNYRIVIFVYDGYETLDVHGPIEMLGGMAAVSQLTVTIELVGATDQVASRQGPKVVTDLKTDKAHECDLFLVPGSTSKFVIAAAELENTKKWLPEQVKVSKKVFSVCSGSAILAMLHQLDGHKATSNKQDFCNIIKYPGAEKVDWQPSARWVDCGKFLSSSGVSAGMDAALYWVSICLESEDAADKIATMCEYCGHYKNPDDDPFAASCSL